MEQLQAAGDGLLRSRKKRAVSRQRGAGLWDLIPKLPPPRTHLLPVGQRASFAVYAALTNKVGDQGLKPPIHPAVITCHEGVMRAFHRARLLERKRPGCCQAHTTSLGFDYIHEENITKIDVGPKGFQKKFLTHMDFRQRTADIGG